LHVFVAEPTRDWDGIDGEVREDEEETEGKREKGIGFHSRL